MKLKDQVCSLELSKKLKELGVPDNDPVWWWRNDYPNNPTKYEDKWYLIPFGDYPYTHEPQKSEKYEDGWHLLPAFTVAELGEMLPESYFTCKSHPSNEWVVCDQYEDGYPPTLGGFEASDKTEADARAKMLIYLLENYLTKASQ